MLVMAAVSVAHVNADSVFDMSLEELMAIEIPSAAKKSHLILVVMTRLFFKDLTKVLNQTCGAKYV